MPDRSSKPGRPGRKKRPADLNRLAAPIVADATGEEPEPDSYEGRTRPPSSQAVRVASRADAHGLRS